MKLSVFFDKVIKFGKKNDPRPAAKIKYFEDSSILYGKAATQVRKIFVGIDIETPELLLADRIRQKEGLDLVISHHPEGMAYASLYKVMRLQIDVLKAAGIKKEIATDLLEERMLEIERKILPQNHMRAVDAARLLDLPFICVHTPADNHVYRFVQRLLKVNKPKTLQNVVDVLLTIPEYRNAEKLSSGPRIFAGNPSKPAGKILVDMTGGTEGPKEAFDKLFRAGVNTIVGMHLSEEHLKKAKDTHLNVVIAGHISSDTLGLNLLLDNIERESGEDFAVICASGFKRVIRNRSR
jgi:putative NIF3 family GTP cyclohydrolase 1 type 2